MKLKWHFFVLSLFALLCLAACRPREPAAEPAGICTLSVDCAQALRAPDSLPPETLEQLPEDGWLLAETQVDFYEGESAFDVLQRVLKAEKLPMEFEGSSPYVTGIGGLYTGDAGEMSGWLYTVNGESPDVGASEYTLQDGDSVAWSYTCDFSTVF